MKDYPTVDKREIDTLRVRWLTRRFRDCARDPLLLALCLIGSLVGGFAGCQPQRSESDIANEAKPPIALSAEQVDESDVTRLTDANRKVANTQSAENVKSPAKATSAIARITDFKPNEIIDRTVPILDEQGVRFTPGQFQKESSLLVLAFEPDIRADYVIMTTRTILSPDQLGRAKQLALSYENQFKVLERKRSAILETATGNNDVDRRMMKVQMELALLLRQIRTRIATDIMTQEQRKEANQLYLDMMAEKSSKEKADANDKSALESTPEK